MVYAARPYLPLRDAAKLRRIMQEGAMPIDQYIAREGTLRPVMEAALCKTIFAVQNGFNECRMQQSTHMGSHGEAFSSDSSISVFKTQHAALQAFRTNSVCHVLVSARDGSTISSIPAVTHIASLLAVTHVSVGLPGHARANEDSSGRIVYPIGWAA